jgi:hypothetical protein
MGAYRQALEQLRPNSKISFSGEESYENLHWKDPNIDPPTKEEVEALVATLKPAWDQWEQDRKAAYPSVEEQLDLLWHTINGGQHVLPGCTWFEKIKQAKASTPKPSN